MFDSVFRWASITVLCPIYASGTTPAALMAPTGTYAVARSPSDSSALLTKSGAFSKDETSGLWTMTVVLTSDDTGGLPVGRLIQQVTVADSDGSLEPFVFPLTVRAALSPAAVGL